MNLIIRYSKVTLNGNQMSGETFPVKGYIKQYLNGTWNAATKTWTVDVNKVNDLINRRAIHIDNSGATVAASNNDSRPCPICGTYCYGDCRSH